MMRIIRWLLFPFSILYGGIVWLRNFLYDVGVFKATEYSFPIIVIGNLSVGGTGKTPMTAYVLDLLKSVRSVGMLSRGYKRSSTGFVVAREGITMEELGDEPYQMHRNFPECVIAVDADRRNGIQQLKAINMLPDVLVLDDAYQHRKVKAGFYMLLTTYNELYVDDFMLPTGNLRDTINQAKRANCIVVTKCPDTLTGIQRERVITKLKPKSNQPVYFTTIAYSHQVIGEIGLKPLIEMNNFTLVTGIAKPEYLVSYLKNAGLTFEHLQFADHHNFSENEIAELRKRPLILTTEKDYVRLSHKIENLYYLPITTSFLGDEEKFSQQLLSFAR